MYDRLSDHAEFRFQWVAISISFGGTAASPLHRDFERNRAFVDLWKTPYVWQITQKFDKPRSLYTNYCLGFDTSPVRGCLLDDLAQIMTNIRRKRMASTDRDYEDDGEIELFL
jgi:hypothetical protein